YAYHRDPPTFPTRRSSDLCLLLMPNGTISTIFPAGIVLPYKPIRSRWRGRDNVHNAAATPRFISTPRFVRAPLIFFQTAEQLARSEEHTSELQSRENLVCR